MSFDTRKLKVGDMFFDSTFKFVGIVKYIDDTIISYNWYVLDGMKDFYSEANVRHDFLIEVNWTPFSTLMQELI